VTVGSAGRIGHAAGEVSNAIRKIATLRNLVLSFILWIVVLILIYGRPFGIAQLQAITAGATILDMTFTTSPQQVYAVLDALGAAGRSFDLTRIVPLDLVFPFTYGLFLALGISWGLSRLLPEGSPWLLLNLAPVIAAAADYCENAGVITLLLSYPVRLDPVAWFVSIMYAVKFLFPAASFITLIASLGGCAVMFFLRHIGRSPA